MYKITTLLALIILAISSCEMSITDSDYVFPVEVPEDPFNPITEGKVELGRRLWEDTLGMEISLSGKINCVVCHTDDTFGGSPDPNFPGGFAEGATLTQTSEGMRYVQWDGYHGKADSMTWVNSRSYANLAFQKAGGLSMRFGNYLNYDEYLSHFKPDLEEVPESFIRDTLIKCEDGAHQAINAFFGHNQISMIRIKQRPGIIDTVNALLGTAYTIETPLYQIAWAMACSLDAFQRVKGYRNNTRAQKILRGEEMATIAEYSGFQLTKTYCTSAEINGIDYSCHHKIDWSGSTPAPSVFPNLPNVPDAANDVTGRGILDSTLVYRKVPTIFYLDGKLYGPHGQYTDVDTFHLDHIAGYLSMGVSKMSNLGPQEISDIIAWHKCL